jgi:preprotein translocase subunit SecF
VLVGTYSSVYVAAPIVLWWSGKSGESLRKEIEETHAQEHQARASV